MKLSLTVAEGNCSASRGRTGGQDHDDGGAHRPDSTRQRAGRGAGVDPVAEPTAVRELVGVLPEKESPPSFMTPREYFDFVGAVRELDDETVDERTETWAERLGFAERSSTPWRRTSPGASNRRS